MLDDAMRRRNSGLLKRVAPQTRRKYAAAVAVTVLATGSALALERTDLAATDLLFIAGVTVASWYGGRGPGLVASALSAVMIELVFSDAGAEFAFADPRRLEQLAVFLLVASTISTLTEALWRARRAAESRAEELKRVNRQVEDQLEELTLLSEELQQSNDELLDARDEAERVALRAMLLQEVTAALSAATTAREVTDVVLSIGLDAMQASHGVIVRSAANGAEVVGSRGYAPEAMARLQDVGIDKSSPLARALRSAAAVRGAPQQFTDRRRHGRAPGSPDPAHPAVALSLVQSGEIIGALGLDFSGPTTRAAVEDAFRLLLARATADALQRAWFFEAERTGRRTAEMLAQAREEVLGIVAHDLRNPLNLISSATEILLDGGVPEERRPKLLSIARNAAARMNRMVGDLLDAARVQAGRLTLELADVDARAIVRQAEEMFRPAAQERQIDFETHCPFPQLQMRADFARVLQVLDNLIGNALKFTEPGGRIALEVAQLDEYVLVQVHDTGPGIPADAMPQLFDRFWQARDGDRRGVGLGLAIVKGIVEAHGGQIWVQSVPGSGSTFSFTLPPAGTPLPARVSRDAAELSHARPDFAEPMSGGQAATFGTDASYPRAEARPASDAGSDGG